MSKKYICNKCGKEIKRGEDIFTFSDLLGSDSKYDGDYIELDLCGKCLDELVNSCKVSPIITTT